MPGALSAAATTLIGGRCIERFGARAVVAGGGLVGVVGFLMLAGWHEARWEVMVAGVLTNAYISLAYGALPALIVSEVGHSETGVATSLNGTFRKVGGAAAAALVGALLTPRSGGLAAESGFTAVFVLGAATAAGSVLLVWLGRERSAARRLAPTIPLRRPTLAAREVAA
ncbi:MAG: MFS transporter [Mycobacterium sp.]|nr:MFS transporter [Mycobacterium sp.]